MVSLRPTVRYTFTRSSSFFGRTPLRMISLVKKNITVMAWVSTFSLFSAAVCDSTNLEKPAAEEIM